MVTSRERLSTLNDRALAALILALTAGTSLAFGGSVWWARPFIAVSTLLLVLAWMLRVLLTGSWRIFKSPTSFLGVLALALAAAQLAPLPAGPASLASPRSREWYALGAPADRIKADDPTAEIPEAASGRSPATLDRPSTLRWLLGATACLALFGVAAQFTDRAGRTLLVWGGVVAGFGINTLVVLVQVFAGARGLFAAIEPGQGPPWAPSTAEILTGPNATALRLAGTIDSLWALPVPDRPFLIGSLLGGPGAYLALASLGLPLAAALTLRILAPRGSRESLRVRLGQSGQGGLLAFLIVLIVAGSLLVGRIAGPLLATPFALGLILAGLPGSRASGLRWTAVGLTALFLAALAGGLLWGGLVDRTGPSDPWAARTRAGWTETLRNWRDSSRIIRDYPILGTGLGGFAAIAPNYKSTDEATTTPHSSVLQWWVEAGAVGMGLLVLGGLWFLCRLPGALRKVGSADKPLAYGLVGAVACFALFSTLHWTVQLPAVALGAAAVLGPFDRWLAGGTDLFVERA